MLFTSIDGKIPELCSFMVMFYSHVAVVGFDSTVWVRCGVCVCVCVRLCMSMRMDGGGSNQRGQEKQWVPLSWVSTPQGLLACGSCRSTAWSTYVSESDWFPMNLVGQWWPWQAMPMGIKNILDIFQGLMHNVRSSFSCCNVRVDDIVIGSTGLG